MRTSLDEHGAFTELPIGRLQVRTIQRITSATVVHHRAGPWAPCSEDLTRIVRTGPQQPALSRPGRRT